MSSSHIAKTAVLLVSLGLAGGAQAAPISPFSAMAGSWSGGGSLSTSDGMQEVLGTHPNSHVIYPMPGHHHFSEGKPAERPKFRLAGGRWSNRTDS